MTKSRENLKETTSKISIKIKVKEAKTLIISQANKEIKIEITEALIRINNLVIIEAQQCFALAELIMVHL